jgi:DNA adenine methylase
MSSTIAYRSVLSTFKAVQFRLAHSRVIIDNRDVERVIEEYDSPTTLHYVDPPYVGTEMYYSYQLGSRRWVKKAFNHERLAEVLNAVKGHVALSYYPHDELDQRYPPDRWRRMVWQQHKNAAIGSEGNTTSMEVLLMNYGAMEQISFPWR